MSDDLTQSFHDNGQLASEGLKVEGLRQGHWRFFFEDGTLKSEGGYLDDKSHGDWRWFNAQGVPTAVGGFHQGERHGDWTWFRADGSSPLTQRGYDKGTLHGVFRSYTADGVLLQEIGYHQGQYHGAYRSFRADGSPEEEANYVHGLLDGERLEWSDKGRKRRSVFQLGVPELPDKRKQSLANQVARAKSGYAKLNVMEKVAPYQSRHAVLWMLVREGFIDAAKDPELWRELAEGAASASADDALALLEAVKRAPKNHGLQLGCWPQSLEALAEAVFQREPEPFLERWKALPPLAKRGMSTLLRRHGHVGREALPKDIAKRLATAHIEQYGLGERWKVRVDGELQEWVIIERQERTERFRPFIELFCDWDAWSQACLELTLARRHSVDGRRSADAFRVANAEQLQQMMQAASHGPYYTPALYQALRAREDSAETLIGLAAGLDKQRPYVGEIALVIAIEREHAAGRPIPEAVDALLGFRAFTEQGSQGYVFLDESRAAFALLPPARRRAILQRQLAETYAWSYALPFLREQLDEDLVATALDRVAGDESANVPHFNRHARAIGTWGEPALARLVARADSLPEGRPRDCFVQAVLYVLGARVQAGGEVPPELDRFLQFKGYVESGLADHYFSNNVLPTLRALLQSMPAERAEAVVLAALRADDDYFARAFAAVEDLEREEARGEAFRIVAERAESLRTPERDWLRWSVDTLKDAAIPHVVAALRVSDHPRLRKSFSEGLGSERWAKVEEALGASEVDSSPGALLEAAAERWFAAHPGAAREPIYLLQREDGPPERGAVSRVGGLPFGVSDDTWPLRSDADGDPEARREHLFTLDLREMPELRAQLGGAAAYAFFINDAMDNEAYSPGNAECVGLLLDEAALALGEYEGEAEVEGRAAGVSLRRVEVPSAVWGAQEGELRELRSMIYRAHARALGEPLWLQSEEHWGQLVLQLDEAFASINLGDMGVMYVFDDTAFWQCH